MAIEQMFYNAVGEPASTQPKVRKLLGVLATVARHDCLAPGYVATAIRNIDALRDLE